MVLAQTASSGTIKYELAQRMRTILVLGESFIYE
jgi:hypothetical protein